jgi:energy-coupling factor transport system ATP-binding protein
MRIRFDNVSYEYRSALDSGRGALDKASFEIAPGESVAIAGSAGSGKTTLVQHLNGLLTPSSGRIFFDGQSLNPKELTGIRKRVGVVFQFPENQLFEETVFDDAAYGPRNFGYPEPAVESAVWSALERVGFTDRRIGKASPFTLSGGEQRRVAIAGILAMEPEMLVLDEPTAGLDIRSARLIETVIREYHQLGRSVVFVSHDMDFTARIAERILVLDSGRILFDGPTRQLFENEPLVKSAGLRLPHTVSFMKTAAEKGLQVRTDCLTVEEAKNELIRVLHNER